jgi:hypothetical protein
VPESEITSLAVGAIVVAGVKVIDISTIAAPFMTLLKVMAGSADPPKDPSTMPVQKINNWHQSKLSRRIKSENKPGKKIMLQIPNTTPVESSAADGNERKVFWVWLGFVTVPKKNEILLPAEKRPDVKLTVSTCPVIIAVPAADEGEVKVSVVFGAHESPLPEIVNVNFPSEGINMAG